MRNLIDEVSSIMICYGKPGKELSWIEAKSVSQGIPVDGGFTPLLLQPLSQIVLQCTYSAQQPGLGHFPISDLLALFLAKER